MKITIILTCEEIYFSNNFCYDCLTLDYIDLSKNEIYFPLYLTKQIHRDAHVKCFNRLKLKKV
jgi:hypothetical protein